MPPEPPEERERVPAADPPEERRPTVLLELAIGE
jgi:hypothetical protein